MRTVLVTTSSFGEHDNDAMAAITAADMNLVRNPFGRRLNEQEAYALFQKHDPIGVVAGVEPLTSKVLRAAPSLKAVARCGTGVDSVDLDTAAALGVRVSRTPDAPAPAVAELTLALMLAVLRRIAEADRALRRGSWKALSGGLLGTRTVGIVGYGRVGRRVAKMVSATGATVIVSDPAPAAVEMPILPLDELLTSSDVVSLHAAGGGLRIGAREFGLMKRGAILINTARGDLVEERSLVKALQNGQIAGAGLDVFENEPYSGPLIGFETVLLTPHMGSYAGETRALQEREALTNLVNDLKLAGALA
jgi:D-3-phosphoglycerate dehydrogenase / 2-oxoglutarate reductase